MWTVSAQRLHHKDYTRLPSTISTTLHFTMDLRISSTSLVQSTGIICQGATGGESQPQRYASFSCYGYWFVSNHGPSATVHVLRPSTSSMMIPFSTYFISIVHFSWTKTMPVYEGAGHGSKDAGGINLRKFARDGEVSSSGRHPLSVFPLSVHTARPLQTCSHIHLPFHLSSITLMKIATSQKKMKKEQYLLSSTVIASVMSAFYLYLVQVCRSSSQPWMKNIHSWNT